MPYDCSAKSPVPISVAVVRREGEVLIGLRPPGGPLAGCWEFPGGKVHPGEAPETAAVRECREETGLTIRITGILGEKLYEYPHARVRLCFFCAEPTDASSTPRPPFRWTPIARLTEYAFPAANAEIIARLLAEARPARENP